MATLKLFKKGPFASIWGVVAIRCLGFHVMGLRHCVSMPYSGLYTQRAGPHVIDDLKVSPTGRTNRSSGVRVPPCLDCRPLSLPSRRHVAYPQDAGPKLHEAILASSTSGNWAIMKVNARPQPMQSIYTPRGSCLCNT